MNWLLFAIVAWVLFGLDLGLAPQLAPGMGQVRPSFVIPLLVYVAMHAPPRSALWAALVLGVLTDLANLTVTHAATTGDTIAVLGPSALGYLLAAQLVVALRSVVLAKNVLTPIILNLLAAAAIGVVVVAVFTLRSFYPDPIQWRPAPRLLAAGGTALYTAALAIPITILLHLLSPWFAFTSAQHQQPLSHARAFKR